MSDQVNFIFNGKSISCQKGQSIAAAVIASGDRELRTTRFGNEPRSIFCGIGVCYDCVVVVNGVANQRSCLIEAKDAREVESAS